MEVSKQLFSIYKKFRSHIASNMNREDDIIGRRNIIVEVDECKFGKVKYNRGQKVDGVWVIGGIERNEKMFFNCIGKHKQ